MPARHDPTSRSLPRAAMARAWLVTALLVSLATPAHAVPSGCLSPDEATLGRLINEYRGQNGKAQVPITRSLTLVAQWKVLDMASPNNPIHTSPATCNLYSWSNDMPSLWSGCCYTPDHAQALCMWNKPQQITGGVYSAFGYEVPGSGFTSVANALAAWKGSPAFNNVLLNLDVWASRNPWPAMGVGVDLVNHYYSVWFGDSADPQGVASQCATAVPDGLPGVALAIEGVSPNPVRGGRMSVSLALPTAAPARLDLLDVTGRRMVTRDLASLGAGLHTVELAAPGKLAAGLYLVVLRQGADTRSARAVVID